MSEASLSSMPPARGRFAGLLGSALGPFLGLLLVVALVSAADYARSRATGKRPTFATSRHTSRASSSRGRCISASALLMVTDRRAG